MHWISISPEWLEHVTLCLLCNQSHCSQPIFLFKWKYVKNSDEALAVVPAYAMKACRGVEE
jgi:hypothetical protein